MKQILSELFKKYNIPHTDNKLDLLCKYYNLVIEENQKFNLTSITEKNDFALKHILDCAVTCPLFPQNATVLDVGSGAGFPGIVLKILRDDLNFTLVDSVGKKVNFLNQTISTLNLKNITAIHTRVEDYSKTAREKFDIVCSRAVASLNTLSEYCLPFVKVGGNFIALKGSAFKEELETSLSALKILGGKLERVQEIVIDELVATRANLVIKKVEKGNPKYPRGKNLPRLKPLV